MDIDEEPNWGNRIEQLIETNRLLKGEAQRDCSGRPRLEVITKSS